MDTSIPTREIECGGRLGLMMEALLPMSLGVWEPVGRNAKLTSLANVKLL